MPTSSSGHAALTRDDPSTHSVTRVVQRKVTTPGYDARTDSLNPALMETSRKMQQHADPHRGLACSPAQPTHPC